MRRDVGTVILLSGLLGCQGAEAPQEPEPLTIEEMSGGGILATLHSEDGNEFTLACDGTETPSFQLNLVEAPTSPPPLRGVYGEFTVDQGVTQRIELLWTGSGGRWLPSDGDKQQEETSAALVRRFVSGMELKFVPPASYASDLEITWNSAPFDPQIDTIKRWCFSGPESTARDS